MALNYGPLMAQLDLSPLHEGIQSARNFRLQSEARDLQQARFEQETAQSAAAQQRQDAFRAAYADAIDSPSQAKFDSLRANFPEQTQPIDSGWKSYSDGQRTAMLHTAGTLVASLANDRPDLAMHSLDQRIQALKRNNVDTTETQTIRDMVASGDPVQLRAARGMAAMILAQQAGDNFDRVWENANQVIREDELQPGKVRAQNADAAYKETRARFAPKQEQATIAGKEARADNARSMRARRDSLPAGNSGPRTSPKPPSASARSATPQAAQTATGPNGEKMVLRGGKWVRVK